MKYNYEECFNEIHTQIKRYKTARNSQSESLLEYQSIRDHVSEALLLFGPTYAALRTNAENAELARKLAYAQRRTHWKAKFENKRGTADEVEKNVLEDLKEYHEQELSANKLFYEAKILVERADQFLNSISSRIKILIKNKHGEAEEN